jgi:hypothetical protein
MKSKITVPAESPPIFPALYRHILDRNVVLFTAEKTGIVVVRSEHFPVGTYNHGEWIACTNSTVWERLPPGTEIVLIQE